MQHELAMDRLNLGFSVLQTEKYRESRGDFEKAIRLGRVMGNNGIAAYAKLGLAIGLRKEGRLGEARTSAMDAKKLLGEAQLSIVDIEKWIRELDESREAAAKK
jgi:hypothetical protein